MKPIATTVKPSAVDRFLDAESRQCICYKLPSYQDGWEIQGLGQLTESTQQTEVFYTLLENNPVTQIGEPSIGILFFCSIAVFASFLKA